MLRNMKLLWTRKPWKEQSVVEGMRAMMMTQTQPWSSVWGAVGSMLQPS